MNDDSSHDTAATAAARPAAETAGPAPVPPARPGAGVPLLGLALAVLALVFTGLLWQRLAHTQEELARRAQATTAQADDARRLAAQAEALTQELQARLAVAELRLSEVSLQRSQLEELMLSLSRSRDDNLVQDLESALRLALQQAQLTGSAQPLVSALQAADQRIARAAQPRLNPVQRAIARDVERIRGTALADIPSLALQLDELSRQVDDWPLLNQVGPGHPVAAAAPRAQASRAAAVAPAEPPAPATEAAAVATGDAADEEDGGRLRQGWARVSDWWSGWWERVAADVARSSRDLVRVSRIDRPEALLLAPDQALYLRENLKLKLLNARLSLLARHLRSAQADLAAVETALARYFDASAPAIRQVQLSLGQLRAELEQSELPVPEETLAALSAAAGGR